MNDKKAMIIIALLLISLTIISILLYFFYPEETLAHKSKEQIVAKIVNFTECQENPLQTYCTKTEKIENKEIEVRYEKMDISDPKSGASLYINNKEILPAKDLVFRVANKIYITDKTVVFATYQANVINIKINIYDFEGKKLKEIYKLDPIKNIIAEDYEFINNKLIISGKKHILFKSVILTQENDNKYIFHNADLCQEYIENQNLNKDDIYTAKWEIEYLTKTRLSTIKIVENSEIKIIDHLHKIKCEF